MKKYLRFCPIYIKLLWYRFLHKYIKNSVKIYLCLEKYRKKYIIARYNTYSPEIENRVNYLFARFELAGNKNDSYIEDFEKFLFYEKYEHPYVRLMYITLLLERGYVQSAKAGLRAYIKKFNLKYIKEYLPCCYVATLLGVKDDIINKGSELFEHLEIVRNNNEFADYLMNKSIAVVGNASNILETELGNTIDSRDVVFRMNLFNRDEKLFKSTGSKLNVYVTNANTTCIYTEHLKDAAKYDWIFIAMDLYHIHLSYFTYINDFIETFYQVIKNTKCKLAYTYSEIVNKLKNECELIAPTTGLRLLYHIAYVRGNIYSDEIFGFSDKEMKDGWYQNKAKNDMGDYFQEIPRNYLYYKNICGMQAGHNINEEFRYRKKLIKNR